MDVSPPRRKAVLAGLLLFAVGFAAGGAVVAGIASRASRAYLKGAQLTFTNEQDRLLSVAWRAGNVHDAVVYAGCALQAGSGDAARRAFDPDANQWTLELALLDALIIHPNEPTAQRVRPIQEAGARSKLAVTWARLGQAEAADRELATAAGLTGKPDASGWRHYGELTIDAWSQVQEKMAAERNGAQQPAKGLE
jgi:hypothetical protein